MMMSITKENLLPDQAGRILRSRRGSSTVPAVPSSLSNDGPPVPCTSGGAGETTPERTKEGLPGTSAGKSGRFLPRVVSVKIMKIDKPSTGSSEASFGGVKATLSSPPPSPVDSDEEENAREFYSGSDTASLGSAEGGRMKTPHDDSSDGSARTTASGTVKRKKRGNVNAPKEKKGPAGKRQKDPEWSISSGEEAELLGIMPEASLRRESRGRSATTGEGFFAREKAQAKRELEELKKEYSQLQRLLHGEFEPREYTGGARKTKEAALELEMRNLPTRDIAAQLVLAARRVEEVATKSSKLKGGFVRQLKEAALNVEVGVDALASRGGNESEQASSLRAEIAALMEENRALRAEKEKGWRLPNEVTECQTPNGDAEMIDVSQTEHAKETRPVLPTREEQDAFPAVRPALRGKRKVLGERVETAVPPEEPEIAPRKPPLKPSAREKKRNEGERDGGRTPLLTSEQLENRLQLFQANMLVEMGRFFRHIRGEKDNLIPQPPHSHPGKKGKGEEALRPTSTKGKGKKKGNGKKGTTTTNEPPAPQEEATWAKVVGRRERKAVRPPPPSPRPPSVPTTRPKRMPTQPTSGKKKRRIRAPTTSAVTITCPKGEYAGVMAEVRANVPLKTLKLSPGEVSVRRGATGSMVVEVAGDKRDEKADALAGAIKMYFAGRGEKVKVARPTKTADIRVSGLEVSITVMEVVQAVAGEGGCTTLEVRAGEMRGTPRGMNSLWLQLPVAAAKKAAQGGILHVGWSRAKIEVLDPRPLRCHRCLERGHARLACTNAADRSDMCYRCAGSGHAAKNCTAPVKCPLCSSIGRKAGHSLGAPECAPQERRGGGGRAAVANAETPAGATRASEVPPPLIRSSTAGRESAGSPPAGNVAEPPKPQRGRRRTTRPLEDGAESEELERAVVDMMMETESDKERAGHSSSQ